MIRRLLVCACLLLLPAAASAQGGGPAFVTGPIAWTPTLSLRDAGIDSNIFNEPIPIEDRSAILTPHVDFAVDSPRLELSGSADVDVVYYEKTESERAVNRRGNIRVEAPLGLFSPVGSFGYTRAKERQGAEVDIRALREEMAASLGLSLNFTTRVALQLTARRTEMKFDNGQVFRGADLAESLNSRTEGLTLGLRFFLTPLTAFQVNGNYAREIYTLSPKKNSENLRADVGVAFAPDAIIRGGGDLRVPRPAPRGPGDDALSRLHLGRGSVLRVARPNEVRRPAGE